MMPSNDDVEGDVWEDPQAMFMVAGALGVFILSSVAIVKSYARHVDRGSRLEDPRDASPVDLRPLHLDQECSRGSE